MLHWKVIQLKTRLIIQSWLCEKETRGGWLELHLYVHHSLLSAVACLLSEHNIVYVVKYS